MNNEFKLTIQHFCSRLQNSNDLHYSNDIHRLMAIACHQTILTSFKKLKIIERALTIRTFFVSNEDAHLALIEKDV